MCTLKLTVSATADTTAVNEPDLTKYLAYN